MMCNGDGLRLKEERLGFDLGIRAQRPAMELGRLTICRCNRKSSLSDPIPPDVLMLVISILPAKSVGKCRSVSKLWKLILGRPEFNEMFLTNSLNRPQFLFAFILDSEATPHNHSYVPAGLSQISQPVRGWVCIECIEDERNVFVICSPLTGESMILPILKRKTAEVKCFLVYDPIEKQFKVLCTFWPRFESGNITANHCVLTLGTEPTVWRKLECCKPLCPVLHCGDGICINGFLYYMAQLNDSSSEVFIVCFDIRFEKLSYINKPEDLWHVGFESRLINHKGQLGIIQSLNSVTIDRRTTCFVLWVLKDIEKHEWTKHIYEVPLLWWDIVGDKSLCIVGMTGTCEVVLLSPYQPDPFYLFFYNLEKNIVRRVEIRGFEGYKHSPSVALCFLDYVEAVNSI
ncbi:F-box protein DOR [Cardamine amara subsp. amara]|uniref:F-box protein DOR n=1 Tax=Cardamine amara subsp. amara TaxID=228776 RepID=A0ABD1BNV2_CARAN